MLPAAAVAGSLSDQQFKYLLIAGGVLVVGGVWYLHWQVGRARDAISEVIPDSPEELAASIPFTNLFQKGGQAAWDFVSDWWADDDEVITQQADL
jgi:hypothetical protein